MGVITINQCRKLQIGGSGFKVRTKVSLAHINFKFPIGFPDGGIQEPVWSIYF